MNPSSRKILVTTALPYANGQLHLGHILEYIQADIFVRFQRMRGHECHFVCGSDAHGTPIMLAAEKQGITPEQLIAQLQQDHARDIHDFGVKFDNFYTTHSPENREISSYIFEKLQQNGDIEVKTIEQAYDPVKNMFLPDRYVKGECPKCGAIDQYGDNCEVCGTVYSPAELKNPVSTLSGATPILKSSDHLFFDLKKYRDFLMDWTRSGKLQTEVVNKLNEWLDHELKPWDISRDAPYFGFEIPGYPNKYFYVWMDAPIGYLASFKNLCSRKSDINFDEFWQSHSTSELYHFVGKDIVYFHALFWPAMLSIAGFRTPTAIFVHGFLTINGQKMSKSKGTFITARDYLEQLNPEYLRYYFAAKLSNTTEDLDLNMSDFSARVNADLVGKVVNIASRSASFIHKYFAGQLSSQIGNTELFEHIHAQADSIAEDYEQRLYAKAVRKMMELADAINQYIDEKKPWTLAKNPEQLPEVQQICSDAINFFRQLMVYLKPIVPEMAEKAETFLNGPPLLWNNVYQALTNHTLNPFTALLTRIDPNLPWFARLQTIPSSQTDASCQTTK